MLAIRQSRRSALRWSRSISVLDCPEASSSSSSSSRSLSSTSTSQQPHPTSTVSANDRGQPKKLLKSPPKDLIANARRLASALKKDATSPPTTPGSLSPSPVMTSSFWDDLLKTPTPSPKTISPSLNDLYSKRPMMPPPVPWHPRYQRLYQNLYSSIDTAFVTKQMKAFTKDLGLDVPARSHKQAHIEKILESWKWVKPMDGPPTTPPPKVEVFDIPPADLFLFLQHPTLMSHFSENEHLQFWVIRASEAPKMHSPFRQVTESNDNRMVLVARGKEAGIKTLQSVLAERQKSTLRSEVSVDTVLGLEAPVGLLQAISNASRAYVELTPEETYTVSAEEAKDAQNAKRLLSMAAVRLAIAPTIKNLHTIYPSTGQILPRYPLDTGTRSDSCSLSPFLLPGSEPLPWEVSGTTQTSGFFRLRRLQEMVEKPDMRGALHAEEKIEVLATRPLVGEESGETTELKSALGKLAEGGKSRLTAQAGYLLLPVERTGRVSTFDSPLIGQWPVNDFERWLVKPKDEGKNIIWTPSLTPVMMRNPTDGVAKKSRRLQYRSVPSSPSGAGVGQKVIKFEYVHPVWQESFARLVDKLEKTVGEPGGLPGVLMEDDDFEEDGMGISGLSDSSLDGGEFVERHYGDEAKPEPVEEIEEVKSIVEEPKLETENGVKEELILKAEIGEVKEANYFVPDRSTDVKFTVDSYTPLQSYPSEITAFFESYLSPASSPDTEPPSTFRSEGVTYSLELDQTVKQWVREKEGVAVKTVKVLEAGGWALQYTEIESALEDGAPSSQFWGEFANVTRDVSPEGIV